jgi:hypothetical protein
MRVRIVLGRLAVRRPASMTDADRSGQRLAGQPVFQIPQLAFGATPRQHATLERGDACGIVAAVFEALERIDELGRSRLAADYSDNAAHPSVCSPQPLPGRDPVEWSKVYRQFSTRARLARFLGMGSRSSECAACVTNRLLLTPLILGHYAANLVMMLAFALMPQSGSSALWSFFGGSYTLLSNGDNRQ